jgi:hypothetical protein
VLNAAATSLLDCPQRHERSNDLDERRTGRAR